MLRSSLCVLSCFALCARWWCFCGGCVFEESDKCVVVVTLRGGDHGNIIRRPKTGRTSIGA